MIHINIQLQSIVIYFLNGIKSSFIGLDALYDLSPIVDDFFCQKHQHKF